MNLSAFSIQRPVFAWVLMFALIFFGALSFTQMGINENPDVDFPTIRISYTYEGATPEVIEKDVIEPVESVLVSMQGIYNMNSTAQRGSASIQLEFDIDKDIDFALQEVQTLLGRAQRQLPDSLDPPVVTKANAADDAIMYLNLRTKDRSDRELMILFRDQIRDRLSTVEGVAEVRAFGYHEPQLRIELNAEALRRYELTAQDVFDSILREHKELPAGRFERGETEESLRIMGELTDLKGFRELVISRRGGSPNFRPLQLQDVAQISEGIENLRRLSRFNGQRALGMAIQKQRGVNAAATADRVKERIQVINQSLPPGTELGINFDATQFIRDSVDELVFTLFLSALLTSLVCWIFLGSWSATFNILLAIPTAVMGSFIFLKAFGFTLNTFSLLGLSLAIGVVVDDAIIMLENIARYMTKGYDRLQASFKGAREISFAVLATTVALVSVFAPIGFLNSIEGKFFLEFVVSISVAVSLSSLEALTLAPMRCSQFLRLEERRSQFGRFFERQMLNLQQQYQRSLAWCLRYSKSLLLVSTALFASSFLALRNLPTEFAPAQDRGVLFAIFLAPDGKSLQYTQQKVEEFEAIVRQTRGVARQFMAVGGFGQGGQSNRGNGVIILEESEKRDRSQFVIAEELREKAKTIEGIRIFIRDRFGGPFGGRRGSPIEFNIVGPQPEQQKLLYEQLKVAMEQPGRIVGVRSDDALALPEVHIVPNRQKALERGVEVGAIAELIQIAFGGVVAAQYTQGSRRFDVWVQMQENFRRSQSDVEGLLLRNNRGELVALSEVVDLIQTEGPQTVYRENRIRSLRVDANLAKDVSQGLAIREIKEMAKQILPNAYSLSFKETPDEKLFDILVVMSLGLLVSYLILSIQFNSFMDPALVFLAIPFGLVGSLLALLLGGQSLNIYSVIGILLTMGIVKKNSILLVEFTNQLRDQGAQISEALLQACPTRLRPILMTSIATLAAAVPPALALGPGSETRVPLALTVLGGVSLSGLISLYIVPCAYALIRPKRWQIPQEDLSQ